MTTPVVFSWSAGKDSAFALWTVLQDSRFNVRALMTTLNEDYKRISMSGVRDELLDRQAELLGLPLIKVWVPSECTMGQYDELMSRVLSSRDFDGIGHVAFADLFLADLRAYREQRLAEVNKRGVFPLWGRDTAELAREMIRRGFKARIVCVNTRVLDESFVGRDFDETFLADLPDGCDPCGENGEFHTFVWDGPLFRQPIPNRTGERLKRDTFAYCDVVPND